MPGPGVFSVFILYSMNAQRSSVMPIEAIGYERSVLLTCEPKAERALLDAASGPGPRVGGSADADWKTQSRGLRFVMAAVKRQPCGEARMELNCAPNMEGITTASATREFAGGRVREYHVSQSTRNAGRVWMRPMGGLIMTEARSLLDISKDSLLEVKDLCERFVAGRGVRGVEAPRRGVDNDPELEVEVRGVAGNIGKFRVHGTA